LPSRLFSINQAWLQLALIAADLLAWTQTILLTSDDDQTRALARAEWKIIRYRLLHTAARLTAPPEAPSYAWPKAGPGLTPWPEPSPRFAKYRCRPENPQPQALVRDLANNPELSPSSPETSAKR
jgi:hypothetical protein